MKTVAFFLTTCLTSLLGWALFQPTSQFFSTEKEAIHRPCLGTTEEAVIPEDPPDSPIAKPREAEGGADTENVPRTSRGGETADKPNLAGKHTESPEWEAIRKLLPLARQIGAQARIPKSVLLAIPVLETGWLTSELSQPPAFNIFAIKASADFQGPVFIKRTREFYDGQWVEIEARFRAYPQQGYLGAYIDFANHLHSDRYIHLFELDPKDYKAWAHGLQQAGYATDPFYARLLIDIIERYELHQFD
jgi:flagellum-specific peptidoglycan hydrolase FlgJ